MATYSTSLKLTLIGDGEQTGTWGSTTNTNLGTLLEQAIVGQTTIIMANADYTLTDLNGVSDEARNAALILTGNQNATYSVIVPGNVQKLYMVTNSLNASAIAYIKPAGGSTFQIPNGRTMYLYSTGTAFVALDYVAYAQNLVSGGTITTGAINCTSLTSTGAISGSTTITAGTQFSGPGTGITGSAAGLSVGGTSLNVTGIVAVVNGGSGVTTATGTGNNVLSTSPTLVTPILGTPQSVALTNATGLPLTTGVTGTLPVANGGTGVTTSTGTGNVVLSASPTLTGSPIAPTQTVGDNSTKIATTAYVATAVTNATGALGTMSTQNANAVAITGGTINGVTGTNAGMTVGNATAAVTATNQSGGTVSATTIGGTTITASSQFSGPGTGLTGTASSLNIGGNAATASTVTTTIASGATGTTQTAGDNSTKMATTAYVATAVTNATGSLGTMSTQNANNVAITGGTINGVSGTNASLTVGNATTSVNQSGGTVSATTIGGTTITASTQFSGPGTGLTGTAASLTVGAASTASVSTTQAYGTINTTIATTAFVQAALSFVFPVGCIYTTTVATNPGSVFGFGTWITYAAGRVLVGAGGAFSGTGGSADATLVSHSHGGLTGTQSQDHTHNFSGNTDVENQGHIHQNATTGGSGVVGPYGGPAPDLEEGAGQPNVSYGDMGTPNVTHIHAFSGTTSGTSVNHQHGITAEGGSATNANMQPYQVVYMWIRTA